MAGIIRAIVDIVGALLREPEPVPVPVPVPVRVGRAPVPPAPHAAGDNAPAYDDGDWWGACAPAGAGRRPE